MTNGISRLDKAYLNNNKTKITDIWEAKVSKEIFDKHTKSHYKIVNDYSSLMDQLIKSLNSGDNNMSQA